MTNEPIHRAWDKPEWGDTTPPAYQSYAELLAERESLLQKVADYHAWGLLKAYRVAALEAEVRELKRQVAAMHTAADGYAGLLAEQQKND